MVSNNLFSGLFIKCSVSQKMQLNEEALNYGCFHPACFGEALLQAVGVSVGPPPLPPIPPTPTPPPRHCRHQGSRALQG